VNYLFVWAAVHQLGYLWRDGDSRRTRRAALARRRRARLVLLVRSDRIP